MMLHWYAIFVTCMSILNHWGRVTHICVGKLTIIGSDNGLSPERRQAIIWTNAGILIIGPLGKNFIEILSEIHAFSLKKIRLKMSSAKCCSFRLGLNVLRYDDAIIIVMLDFVSSVLVFKTASTISIIFFNENFKNLITTQIFCNIPHFLFTTSTFRNSESQILPKTYLQ